MAVPFWVSATLLAFVVVQLRATAWPAATVVGVAVRVAVGPEGGGAGVTVTDALAVAGWVPVGPVAVRVNVVVPTVESVKGIPCSFSGLPSSATGLSFWVSVIVLAFWVCQLTITLSPA